MTQPRPRPHPAPDPDEVLRDALRELALTAAWLWGNLDPRDPAPLAEQHARRSHEEVPPWLASA